MRGFIAVILLGIATLCGAVNPPADLLEAMEICDCLDLRPVEGIWEYPGDETTVIVLRDDDAKDSYGIYIVESADCLLSPGMRIGTLTETVESNKFRLSQYTDIKKNILSLPCDASARLTEENRAMIVSKPSIKIKFYPSRFLPSFWKGVGISVKNPDAPKEGMIKVYPGYDNNNSSRRKIRYL